MKRFENRRQAGQLLATELHYLKGHRDLLILALPRGGVPVAFEVARSLEAPLDVLIVRKLGVPGHDELAMGAIASGGAKVLNQDVISELGISDFEITRVMMKEEQEIIRRERLYRLGRDALDVEDKWIVLVDDGLATGATMLAAIRTLRKNSPAKILVAVPVAPPSTCAEVSAEADEFVCLNKLEPFGGVGYWYRDFTQTTDDEVRSLLQKSTINIITAKDRNASNSSQQDTTTLQQF